MAFSDDSRLILGVNDSMRHVWRHQGERANGAHVLLNDIQH